MDDNKIFLDANFLASYLIPNHKNFNKSRIILSKLLKNDYELHVSPLCIYELWNVIKKYHDFFNGNFRIARKLNKYLKILNLKFIYDEKNSSYKNIISRLEEITDEILDFEFIKIEPIEKNDISIALKAVKDFDQKPGDAFHFSIMKKCNIDKIATYDNGFKRMGLKIIKD